MAFPARVRKRIGRQRGWKCEYPGCRRTFDGGWLIECHHILPSHSGGADTEDNAELLCTEHHLRRHVQLARRGLGHPNSVRLVKARLRKTKGRTRSWLKSHKS